MLPHLVLCGAPNELLLRLAEAGASISAANEQISLAEAIAWRGLDLETSRVLLQGEAAFPRSRLIAYTPLHIALVMNHAHLLELFWKRCERLPYSATVYTGEKVDVSLTAMAERFFVLVLFCLRLLKEPEISETLTDETLAALLELTTLDVELQESLRAPAGGGNNNNAPLLPPPPPPPPAPKSNLIVTGPLLKHVKTGRFRKYVQTRMCSLLLGETEGEFLWRDAPSHQVFTFVEIPITGAFVKGSMLTVTTLQGPLLYQITNNRADWTSAIAAFQDRFPIPHKN